MDTINSTWNVDEPAATFGGRFAVSQGSVKTISFALSPAGSIEGQTFEVRVVDKVGNYDTVTIVHSSLSVAPLTGGVDAILDASALAHGIWDVELWRADSGSQDKLAWIEIEVQGFFS
jgi:hypothetical protein